MTSTFPFILLVLTPAGWGQPYPTPPKQPAQVGPTMEPAPAAPVAPPEGGPILAPVPAVAPPPPVPAIYPSPAPPLRTGAWWYGAIIPIPHQRDLYYPTWDTPVLTCKGYPPFGAPAVDIPQGVVPVYWIRNGQGACSPVPTPAAAAPPAAGLSAQPVVPTADAIGPAPAVAAPTTSEGIPHPPTVP